MKEKTVKGKDVKCFGCGAVLDGAEKEIGLCKSCSKRSVEEGFELFDANERDAVRAEAMMYA